MPVTSIVRRTPLAALVIAAALAAPALGQATTPGSTAPSAERSLSFPAQGIVAEALVREGDVVKAGQPLMRLDDREEAKRLEALKIAAEGERLKVTASEKELALKRVELERKQGLLAKKAVSEQEVLEAELAVDLAEIQVELAKQQAVGADAQAAVQQIRVEEMTLTGARTTSPVGRRGQAQPRPRRVRRSPARPAGAERRAERPDVRRGQERPHRAGRPHERRRHGRRAACPATSPCSTAG